MMDMGKDVSDGWNVGTTKKTFGIKSITEQHQVINQFSKNVSHKQQSQLASYMSATLESHISNILAINKQYIIHT